MTFYSLFKDSQACVSPDDSPYQGPKISDLNSLTARLRAAQVRLAETPIDEIIGLLDEVARQWMRPDHPLAEMLQKHSLGFLPLLMRRSNLESICDLSANGVREALDTFVSLSHSQSRRFRAQPRGIVVHWIAGNVPVLGMISLLQGLLTKNANLIKAPAEYAGLLPALLDSIGSVESLTINRKKKSGRLLTDAVSVIYVDREDVDAARELSLVADVRVAWGNRIAVETIMNLPRRFGTEDIIFGPKVSFIVVGAERLKDEKTARLLAQDIVYDVSAFDQQGCNAPHTIFVEHGGKIAPEEFSEILSQALDSGLAQRPLRGVAAADSMRVLTLRAKYDMCAKAFYSKGISWTVLYGSEDEGLATPCYLRTLFVRPVNDIFDVVDFCSNNTQSAGLALDETRRLSFAEVITAKGVDRCPVVGKMSLYEAPWDGMFPIERMVRWTSVM